VTISASPLDPLSCVVVGETGCRLDTNADDMYEFNTTMNERRSRNFMVAKDSNYASCDTVKFGCGTVFSGGVDLINTVILNDLTTNEREVNWEMKLL